MNRFRNLIALSAFSLLVLALPNFASAQYRNNRNDDGYYGSNNNNNNRNLQSTVRNLKNHSREFERRLDRELDRSRYDGSSREDRLLQIAQQFKDATESLDRSYDNRNDYSRSQDEARRVLQLGSQLERAVSRSSVSGNLNNDLNRIRQDLSVLANAYNYNNNRNGGYGNNRRGNDDGNYDDDDYNRNDRGNNNNRNNRRGNNNNDWRRNFPFPLPF